MKKIMFITLMIALAVGIAFAQSHEEVEKEYRKVIVQMKNDMSDIPDIPLPPKMVMKIDTNMAVHRSSRRTLHGSFRGRPQLPQSPGAWLQRECGCNHHWCGFRLSCLESSFTRGRHHSLDEWQGSKQQRCL